MLSHVAEENQRRDSELRPSSVRLQCLRCRSEFTVQGEGSEEEAGGRARNRGAAILPESVEEFDQEESTECDNVNKGDRSLQSPLRNSLTNRNMKKLMEYVHHALPCFLKGTSKI